MADPKKIAKLYMDNQANLYRRAGITPMVIKYDLAKKAWVYEAGAKSGDLGITSKTVSITTMRKKLAQILGKDFPSAARNDDAWTFRMEGYSAKSEFATYTYSG
jgi:hypothetical protein